MSNVSEPYVWQPLTVADVTRRMRGFEQPWWFAGGQAIDAFLGYESRSHGDIDIACLRRDPLAMQRQLASLDLWCAEPPGGLRPWRDGEWLPVAVHDIWCHESPDQPWRRQLMLDEAEDGDWVYRRNPAVRLPLDSLIVRRNGVPYLAVEVQLLYKAPDAAIVAKNQRDFEACLPHLDERQRIWLASALQPVDPEHAWIDRLGFEKAASNT